MENVNEKHKDTVFTFLFSNPDLLRELYSAIEGITLPPDIPININTLSDVLFRTQRNDISFLINNRLIVLIEHQSTINNNMPLRFMMYSAKLYQGMTDPEDKFKRKLEKIPKPEFIVLYNGEDRKKKLLEKSFRSAINYCIKNNILKDFLKKHSSEVINMLYGEYDPEVEMRVVREEALEEGIEIGREEGEEIGMEKEKLIIAKNLLEKGSTPEFVHEITGLTLEKIEEIEL